MAKNVTISQKEYNKLLKQSEEFAELQKTHSEYSKQNLDCQERLQKADEETVSLKNELFKKSKLNEAANNTIDELKKQISETAEVRDDLIKKVAEQARKIGQLEQIEKAYVGMRQSVKTLLAHAK